LLFPPKCAFCKEIIPNAEGKKVLICRRCKGGFNYFPKDSVCCICGTYTENETVCLRCSSRTESFFFERNFAVTPYVDDVRRAIYDFKYAGDKRLARLFAEITAEYCDFEEITFADMFIPVPISSGKLKKRRFNQSRLFADELSIIFGKKVADILLRERETRPQSGLSITERTANVSGAFSMKNKTEAVSLLKGSSVVIVDDIFTTGATINECAKVIKNYGAEHIFGLTFAAVYKNKN
ncbi:MAG: ComF family protein, partial [Clostridiales bacterium]|jgi:ComF family protein|nr:ComF family protein [Clostridiales bacterium]